ncbi:hypothetical protein H0H93_006600 [Arthromyces matolae]|nr:hypothetical protein H0H93_006600 [Arthromyces matolae]
MTRKKDEGKLKPAGRTSDFPGTKLAFLDSRETQWHEAQKAGPDAVSNFYSRITRMFLQQWGFGMPFGKEVPMVGTAVDSVGPEIPQFDCEGLSDAEIGERVKVYEKLRTSASIKNGTQEVIEAIQEMFSERPRKPTVVSAYSKQHYNDRLKEGFDKEWEKVKDSVSPSLRLSMCSTYEVDDKYKKQLKIYKKGGAWAPRTAKEYSQAVKDSPTMLYPIADAIAQRTGMYVTIMLSGPMDDGKVGGRSVHSNVMGGCVEKIWPEYDSKGFALAEKSLIGFASKFFSPKDCEARKVIGNEGPDMEMDDEENETPGKSPTPRISSPPKTAPSAVTAPTPLTAPSPPVATLASKESEPAKHGPALDTASPGTAKGPTMVIDPSLMEDGGKDGGDNDVGGGATGGGSGGEVETTSRDRDSVTADQMTSETEVCTPTATIVPPGDVFPPQFNFSSMVDVTNPANAANGTNGTLLQEEISLDNVQSVTLRGALTYLIGKEWGDDWQKFVHAYFEFEKSRGFVNDDGRLPTIERPFAIQVWMKNARPLVDQKIDPSFPGDMTRWWQTLKDMTKADVGTKADYSIINKGGNNGLLLVAVGLCWWGERIEEIGRRFDGEDGWLHMVRDVGGMLHFLRENHAKSTSSKPASKRKNTENSGKSNKKAK